MNTQADFIDFLDIWAAGTARAITQRNFEMLEQLTTCVDRLDDAHCEQLDLPPGTTVGRATTEVLELLEEWQRELVQ
jgi:hypothetical protein